MLISPFTGRAVHGTQFVVVEWTAPPDPDWIAPLHRHHQCDEAWYVLEGQLELQVDGQLISATTGDLVWAKAGESHTYRNSGSAATRYLLIMTPKIMTLIDAIHATPDRSRLVMARIFRDNDSEYLGFP